MIDLDVMPRSLITCVQVLCVFRGQSAPALIVSIPAELCLEKGKDLSRRRHR